MKVLRYTKATKESTLQGYLDLEVTKFGCMTIRGIRVFMKNGKRFISFPAEKVQKEGKDTYFPYIFFPSESKDFRDKFEKAILDALDKYCLENSQKPPQTQNKPSSEPDDLPF